MHFNKKYIALFISAVFLLSACTGSGNTPSDSETSEPAASSTLTEEDLQTISDKISGLYLGTEIPDDAIQALITTSLGDISITLFPTEAPIAVENFVAHANNGYYDNMPFHRVINDFIIQSGDPNGDGGVSASGEGFDVEFYGSLYHFNGALSMSNNGTENSNFSQFFIVNSSIPIDDQIALLKETQTPSIVSEIYSSHHGAPSLDWKYTVFGYVTEGMDIVNQISSTQTDENNTPLDDIIINSIEII